MKPALNLIALRYAFFFAALACALAYGHPPADLPALRVWAGAYVYEPSGRATASGVVVPVTYLLTVAPGGQGPSIRLQQTGTQVDRVLLCDANASPSRLVVYFRSFANGNAVNEYGVAEFVAGQELFSIQRAAGEHRSRLKTSWKALRPDGSAASGSFFVRAAEGKIR